MDIFSKPTEEITTNDVLELIQYHIPESETLDYKGDIWTDAIEFAADISSFANNKGGLVIVGIPTEKKRVLLMNYR